MDLHTAGICDLRSTQKYIKKNYIPFIKHNSYSGVNAKSYLNRISSGDFIRTFLLNTFERLVRFGFR